MASNLRYKWFPLIIKLLASLRFCKWELSNGFHSALKCVPSVMWFEFGLRPGEIVSINRFQPRHRFFWRSRDDWVRCFQ